MIDRVQRFYDANVEPEWNRLTQGLSAVEFATTLALVRRHFPAAGEVADIGGGPGRYAIELSRMGHAVTLFDLSPRLLARAATEANRAGIALKAIVPGTATDLHELESGTFQAALMLGPLIHLTTRSDRLAALAELRRILAPGGVAIVSYLNSWGLVRTGLTDFPGWYDSEERITRLLQDQTFEDQLSGFTDCYWSTPPVAIAEVEDAGFTVATYVGAESFLGGMAATLDAIRLANRARYDTILQVATTMAGLPQYRDATDHLSLVLRSA